MKQSKKSTTKQKAKSPLRSFKPGQAARVDQKKCFQSPLWLQIVSYTLYPLISGVLLYWPLFTGCIPPRFSDPLPSDICSDNNPLAYWILIGVLLVAFMAGLWVVYKAFDKAGNNSKK